jgi:hypothetical protein
MNSKSIPGVLIAVFTFSAGMHRAGAQESNSWNSAIDAVAGYKAGIPSSTQYSGIWNLVVDAVGSYWAEMASSNAVSNATWSKRRERVDFAVDHVRESAGFREFVWKSMKEDKRGWVQGVAADILYQGLRGRATADQITSMLVNSNTEVRATALIWIHSEWRQDLAVLLPFGLMSTNSLERFDALEGIRDMCGARGLPYYAVALYDADPTIAVKAADGFAKCEKEDAVPLLLSYLKQFGIRTDKRQVVREVITVLNHLYREQPQTNSALGNVVSNWVRRLELEIPRN